MVTHYILPGAGDCICEWCQSKTAATAVRRNVKLMSRVVDLEGELVAARAEVERQAVRIAELERQLDERDERIADLDEQLGRARPGSAGH